MNLLSYDPLAKSKFKLWILGIVILLAAVIRLTHLDKLPPGLNQDESAIGYNAYLINETGTDEYGNSFPLYFKSFGDYKLPVYIYSSALAIKIFGLNEFAVRLPSALAGILTIVALYYFIHLTTKNTTLSIITALSLALNPWHIFFSRAAFEVNLALCLATSGCIFFLLAIQKKRFIYLVISIILFVLCLYTYNVTRLVSPVLFIILCLMNRKALFKFSKFQIILGIVIGFIFLIPFIQTFFSKSGVGSAEGSLISSTDILAKNVEMRSYVIGLPSVYVKLFFNKYIYLVWQYFQNLGLILSGSFFFVDGTTHATQGIGNVGTFYLFDLPFFLLGIFVYFHKKLVQLKFFLYWIILATLVLALSKQVPHTTRGYFLLIPSTVFIGLGILYFFQTISQKKIVTKYITYGVTFCFVIFNIQFFFLSYIYRFPFIYNRPWRVEDKVLTEYLKENENNYDRIIIDKNIDYIYTSFLFYSNYPPQKFLSTVKRFPEVNGRLLLPESFGKYVYKEINWPKDVKRGKTLLITNLNDRTIRNKISTKIIKSQTKNIVLSVDEGLLQAPQNDTVYILIDLNKITDKEIVSLRQ